MNYCELYFQLIENCNPETGAFTFQLPPETMQKLERLCRYELGIEPASTPKDPITSLEEELSFWYPQMKENYAPELISGIEGLILDLELKLAALKKRKTRKHVSTNQLPDIGEVKQSIDIVGLISQYVPLRKKGKDWWAVNGCPFHSEKTSSFSVNPRQQYFHCFGCGAHGDAFDFLQRVEGIELPEAIRRLS